MTDVNHQDLHDLVEPIISRAGSRTPQEPPLQGPPRSQGSAADAGRVPRRRRARRRRAPDLQPSPGGSSMVKGGSPGLDGS